VGIAKPIYERERDRNGDRDPFNKWSNLTVYVPDFDATFAAVFQLEYDHNSQANQS